MANDDLINSNSTTLNRNLIEEARKRFENAEREKAILAAEAKRLREKLEKSSNTSH